MSVSYEQIQKYAEAVGWKVEKKIGAASQLYYWVAEPGRHPYTITSIRETLAAKYRELAEQSVNIGNVVNRLHGHPERVNSQIKTLGYAWLMDVVNALSEPEEPTMLERLKKEREHLKREPGNRMGMVFDALIALYKAKE